MRPAIAVAILLASTGAGFLAGSAYQSHVLRPEAQLEDYAVQNILGSLAIANYAAKADLKSIRSYTDIEFTLHLNYVRRFGGAIQTPEFEEAKIRSLDALAVLWKAEPPFTGPDYQATSENQFWLPEWRINHTKNLQLLAWAQAQCESRPTIPCKRSGPK